MVPVGASLKKLPIFLDHIEDHMRTRCGCGTLLSLSSVKNLNRCGKDIDSYSKSYFFVFKSEKHIP